MEATLSTLPASMLHHSWPICCWLKAYWHTCTFLLPCALFIFAFLITCSRTSVILPFWVISDFTKVPLLESRDAWVFKRSLLKQQSNIRDVEKEGAREKVGKKKYIKQRKGHFYLGEHRLSKLQWSAIKKLKLPTGSPQQPIASSKLWVEQQLI